MARNHAFHACYDKNAELQGSTDHSNNRYTHPLLTASDLFPPLLINYVFNDTLETAGLRTLIFIFMIIPNAPSETWSQEMFSTAGRCWMAEVERRKLMEIMHQGSPVFYVDGTYCERIHRHKTEERCWTKKDYVVWIPAGVDRDDGCWWEFGSELDAKGPGQEDTMGIRCQKFQWKISGRV
jgi:hypothetical protein